MIDMDKVKFLVGLLLILIGSSIFSVEASYLNLPEQTDFLPELHYEEGHMDFPVNIYFDGDNDVENNSDVGHYVEGNLTGNQKPIVYVNVNKVLDADKDGDPFWTIEYHYYYVKNYYAPLHWNTHRHDWEWVYVAVIEDENGYTPLLASSGSHDTSGSNSETFRRRKYGRYSNDYLKFTENGKFGSLGIDSGKRAIFYVGNDGNAMYGTTQCDDIGNPWRIGNINAIGTTIGAFDIISVTIGEGLPEEFNAGGIVEGGILYAPWARSH
jgi:hypothetical protein